MALNYTKGNIASIGEVKSGTGSTGKAWYRQELVLEIAGYQGAVYKIVFSVTGEDRIKEMREYKVSDSVEIGWSIYAREYNGRLFNNVDLVTIKHIGRSVQAPNAQQNESLEPQKDDLPF